MTDNDGNLKKQHVDIPKDEAVSSYISYTSWFSYDLLNRLQEVHGERWDSGTSVVSDYWKQSYLFDRYGNRRIDTNPAATFGYGINNKDFTVNTTNNRLGVPIGQTGVMSYDAAGNLTNDTYTGAGARNYDAENRMISAAGGINGQLQYYTYNADGQRTRRKIEGVETWQVYGFDGELLAEYAANASSLIPQKEYGYRNGQLLITGDAPRTNYARSANGATATAKNYTQDGVYPGLHFQPSYAIDGSRHITNPSGDQYWRDEHGLPSWIEINFGSAKTIDEIDVFTVGNAPSYYSDPSPTLTFTQSGATAFDVQYWNGSAWVNVTGGSITGNNLVWRRLNFAPISTSKIRVVVNATIDGVARIAEVEAWGGAPPPVNYARSSNGATITAQNYTQDGVYPGLHFQPSYANDGVRYITTSGDHYWRDEHGLPSWIQVDFGASKTISEIDVFTVADYPAYLTQSDPSPTQTFTQYGVTAFEVQYWTGTAWVNVPGGSITGNNLVWRKLTFSAISTSRIRVVVNSSTDGVARIAEVEAWGPATAAATDSEINWLVTDQLGTPRMVFDKTGSLATVKRHDYLPFGEEMVAWNATTGVAGRRTNDGYVSDNIRQKFTLKERDNETGLDYFLARYYSSTAGRFMSVDPLAGHTEDPQTLNRYVYTRNNPLKYVDPDGLDFWIMGQGDYCKEKGKCDKEGFAVDEKGNRFIVKNNEITNRQNDISPTSQQSTGGYTAVVNEAGVQITNMGGQTFTGVFTENAINIPGAGKLSDFTFDIGGSDLKAGVLAKGTFEYRGTNEQTRQTLAERGAFSYVLDPLNPFHPDTTQFRFAKLPPLLLGITDHIDTIRLQTEDFGTSSHLSVANHPKSNVPKTTGEWHVDNKTGAKHLSCAVLGRSC